VRGQKNNSNKGFKIMQKVEMKKISKKIFFILKLNQEIVFVKEKGTRLLLIFIFDSIRNFKKKNFIS